MASTYLIHYNHNHDKLGRFARSPGSSGRTRKARGGSSGPATEKERPRRGLSDTQKKILVAGAVGTASVLALYGGYKLYQSGLLGNMQAGSDAVDHVLGGKQSGLFDRIDRPESDALRLRKCNPLFTNSSRRTPYNHNCANAVIANELRFRGEDVQARGNLQGMTIAQMGQFFNGINSKTFCEPKIEAPDLSIESRLCLAGQTPMTPRAMKELIRRGRQIEKQMASQLSANYPVGSRGGLMITAATGSHWVSWENKGGRIKFTNPQNPKLNLKMFMGAYVYFPKSASATTTAMRLDDLDINTSSIGSVVTNYGNSSVDSKLADWASNDAFGRLIYYNKSGNKQGSGQDFDVTTSVGNNFVMTDPTLKKIFG